MKTIHTLKIGKKRKQLSKREESRPVDFICQVEESLSPKSQALLKLVQKLKRKSTSKVTLQHQYRPDNESQI